MAGLAVGQDQRVLAVGMLEEIIDPIFLHQPANEIEIRLAVLDAIFERRRRTGGRVAKVREAAVGEHLLDDVDWRLLREDPTVGCSRQQPKPGSQQKLVNVEILVGSGPVRLGHHAIEISLMTILRHQPDGGALPESVAEVQIGLGADRLDAEFEQFAQPFARAQSSERERIFAERRRQLTDASVLGKSFGHRVLSSAWGNGPGS